MAGLGIFADVGQRLLDDAVDRELGGFRQFHLFQIGRDFDAAALAELARQDFQRCRQAQVGQGGRAQVLDDAALEGDAAVERLHQVADALAHVRGAEVDLGFEARHVELGCRQQRAQLVVEFARQMSALVLAHLLQVVGQLRQRGRALAHQGFEAVALVALDLLLALVGLLQRVRLAQVHEKAQHAQGRDRGDAYARQRQRVLDVLQVLGRALVYACQQLARVVADGIHVLHAHVGEHDEAPGLLVALAVQAQAELHLAHLSFDLARQRREDRQLLRVVDEDLAQLVHVVVDGRDRLAVGLQVALLPRQQVAAQARLRIQHQPQQLADLRAGVLGLGHGLQRLGGALVAGLVNADQQHGRDDGECQADRNSSEIYPTHKHPLTYKIFADILHNSCYRLLGQFLRRPLPYIVCTTSDPAGPPKKRYS